MLVMLGSTAMFANAQEANRPITKSQLIALPAGGALNENIILEVKVERISVSAHEEYRSLLATAGGNAALLAALNAAKTDDSAQSGRDGGNG